MAKKVDFNKIKWQKYWRLTVIEQWDIKNNKQKILVKCDCWTIKCVKVTDLIYKRGTRSCWCLAMEHISNLTKTHWMYAKHWICNIYYWILRRCYKKWSSNYKDYWWRWIKCERKTFLDFYDDMWKSYKEHVEKYWEKDTTIERIDVNWNYCKENCRRATYKEQARNRRSNTKVMYEWQEYILEDICRMFNLDSWHVWVRLKQWEDIYHIIQTYKHRNPRKKIEYNWKMYWIRELAEMYNMDSSAIYKSLKRWNDIYHIIKNYQHRKEDL